MTSPKGRFKVICNFFLWTRGFSSPTPPHRQERSGVMEKPPQQPHANAVVPKDPETPRRLPGLLEVTWVCHRVPFTPSCVMTSSGNGTRLGGKRLTSRKLSFVQPAVKIHAVRVRYAPERNPSSLPASGCGVGALGGGGGRRRCGGLADRGGGVTLPNCLYRINNHLPPLLCSLPRPQVPF